MSEDFKPDWLSAPGGTILDVIEENGLSSKELGKILGYSVQRTERLLAGKDAITRDVARLLSEKIGGSEKFWLSRELNYRSEVARQQSHGSIEAAKAWLHELPMKDMQKFGWVRTRQNLDDNVAEALQFFGVANVAEWRKKYEQILSAVAFRTSPTYKSEPSAILAWLRRGEKASAETICARWNATSFERALVNMRRLTRKKDPSEFLPELQGLCAKHGVALVFARAPAGCYASGATLSCPL